MNPPLSRHKRTDKRHESKVTKPALVQFIHQAKHNNANQSSSLPGSQGVNEMKEREREVELMNEMSEIDVLKQLC